MIEYSDDFYKVYQFYQFYKFHQYNHHGRISYYNINENSK